MTAHIGYLFVIFSSEPAIADQPDAHSMDIYSVPDLERKTSSRKLNANTRLTKMESMDSDLQVTSIDEVSEDEDVAPPPIVPYRESDDIAESPIVNSDAALGCDNAHNGSGTGAISVPADTVERDSSSPVPLEGDDDLSGISVKKRASLYIKKSSQASIKLS